MNPPTANPVLPADAPREDPSTVEALPAVPPAANPSDAADSATTASPPNTHTPGSTPNMPERIRRLIPRHGDGRAPCSRIMGGGTCYGGSAERCAHQQRTHPWDSRLRREL
ncbi:hypothetical protein PF002_g4443 [Phytophthora fragariae]|uniref:Uncharacterized protein n=2 Tax=Phytophthora fragariae TaxID=53985 RepID=A0A6A4ABG8_9STRA|nr:hypothetical protein PF002_g4443 [Phytophthora fragariae]